jgi:hypothetical protein
MGSKVQLNFDQFGDACLTFFSYLIFLLNLASELFADGFVISLWTSLDFG